MNEILVYQIIDSIMQKAKPPTEITEKKPRPQSEIEKVEIELRKQVGLILKDNPELRSKTNGKKLSELKKA